MLCLTNTPQNLYVSKAHIWSHFFKESLNTANAFGRWKKWRRPGIDSLHTAAAPEGPLLRDGALAQNLVAKNKVTAGRCRKNQITCSLNYEV